MSSAIELADWRRKVSDLYGRVRNNAHPRAAWRDWVSSRQDLFRNHPQSPLEPDDKNKAFEIPVFAYEPRFRFDVGYESVPDKDPITIELGADGTIVLKPALRTLGLKPRLDAELTIYWIGGYGGGLFLPFRDATSGAETYGGGRYLLDGIKGADLGQTDDGHLILDFNFAYNPTCAWSPNWVCPLAPAENTLSVPVRAGERVPELDII